jgi:hypothetical protein
MWFNPFLAQRLAEEHIRDMLREAERERLLRRAAADCRSPVLSRARFTLRPRVEGPAFGWALFALGLVGVIIAIWQLV